MHLVGTLACIRMVSWHVYTKWYAIVNVQLETAGWIARLVDLWHQH